MGPSRPSRRQRNPRRNAVAHSAGRARALLVERLEDRFVLATLAEMVPIAGGGGVTANLSSYPASIVDANGVGYFTADDGINGFELWRINSAGTAELVEDAVAGGGINPGSLSSSPQFLTNVGGTLYFQATHFATGKQIWRINGAGIAELVDDGVAGGFAVDSLQSLTNVAGTLYFVGKLESTGVELWRVNSSGMEELVEDAIPGGGLSPGAGNSNPKNLVNVNGTLFFSANDGTNGEEIWRINGLGPAEMVEDSVPGGGIAGSSGVYPQNLIDANGTLYFSSGLTTTQTRLWRVEGAGMAQPISVVGISGFTIQSAPDYLTNVGGTVYFRMSDQMNGQELWRIDADNAARLVEDAVPGGGIGTSSFGSRPSRLTVLDAQLYFNADSGKLWRMNASGLAEKIVYQVPGGSLVAGYGSDARDMTSAGGTVFFTADDPANNRRLWRLDATGVAQMVDDDSPGIGFNTGIASLAFSKFLSIGDTLYFNNATINSRSQLWRVKANGNAEIVPVPLPASSLRVFVSNPYLTNVGGRLYFRGTDHINGYELWRTDGHGGLELVEDAIPGGGLNSRPAALQPRNLTNVSGTLYFLANDGVSGDELWRLDSQGAAEMVEDSIPGGGISPGARNSYPSNLTDVDGTLYFGANDNVNGYELWRIRSDGRAEMVEDSVPGGGICPGSESSRPTHLISSGGTLYFTATDGVNGVELWRITGAGNAEMVEDSIAGGGIGFGAMDASVGNLASLDGQLYFAANDRMNGLELWRINAASRAEMVEDGVAGGGLVPTGSSYPNNFTLVNGTLYFTADFGNVWRLQSGVAERLVNANASFLKDVNGTLYFSAQGSSGLDLWRLKGGTIPELVKAARATVQDPYLALVNGTLYFRMKDGTIGAELWRINSAGAAELVDDSVRGGGMASLRQLTDVGGTLYFSATNEIFSGTNELWRINGAGIAEMVEDAVPGNGISISGGSNPLWLTNVNGTLYFSAKDDVNGYELWRLNDAGIAEMVEDSAPGGGLSPGSGSSDPRYLTAVAGRIYFAAYGGPLIGTPLWVIDPNGGVPTNGAPTSMQLSGPAILEGSAPGAVAGVLSSQDPDVGDSFAYSLVPGEGDSGNSSFFVAGDRLQLAATPNFETQRSYSVRIRSTDRGDKFFERVFTIEIANAAPAKPADVDDGANSVLDNFANGAMIGLTARSLDPAGGMVTYRLAESAGGRFTIDPATGVVTVADANRLSVEAGVTHTITVSASDGILESATDFSVNVRHFNRAPTAIELTGDAVAENAAGVLVGNLSAIDPDSGDTHVFSTVDTRFTIVGDELWLKPGVSFDFEDDGEWSVVITAQDNGSPSLSVTQTVTLEVIDVNEAPTAIALSASTVAENLVGGMLGNVLVSDQDSGASFTYTVDDTRFEIVGGALRLKASVALNFEGEPSVPLNVQATDNGGLSITRPFAITVTNVNEAPLSVALSAAIVIENAIEQAIGNVTGVDPDAGDALTFTVDDPRFEVIAGQLKLKGLQSLNFESEESVPIVITAHDVMGLTKEQSFTITVADVNERPTNLALGNLSVNENLVAGAVGAISVQDEDGNETQTLSVSDTRFEIVGSQLKLKAGASLNYESTPSVALSITTVDHGGLSLTQDFTILVNDVNEVPTAISLSADTVPENAPAHTLVGSFAGVDPDNGDVVTFTVDDERFSVDAGQLFTTRPLDAEATPTIRVDVTATDAAGLSTTHPFTITVTNVNEAPSAISTVFNPVPENVASAVVGSLTVTDPDSDAVFTFSVADARFEIIDGKLKLKEGQTLDYEDGASISISVTARDAGNLAWTQSVALAVIDAPEAPTDIRLSRSKAFNGITGAWIAEVRVIDDDPSNAHTFEASDPRFEVRQGQLYLKPGQSLSDVAGATIRLSLEVRDAAANATLSKSFDLEVENGPIDWLFGNQWRPNRYDVNADGAVTPLDALLVINQLNARGPTGLDRIPGGTGGPRFFDTSGDDAITALDALDVIIYLNSGAKGEGQSSAPFEDATDVTFTDQQATSGSLDPYAFFWWDLDGKEDERSEWMSR
jgi:ELWxxDGT repeat protein